MTSAAKTLELKRLETEWWWFSPEHRSEKSAAACVWETLRRTDFYRALWREHEAALIAVQACKFAPGDGPVGAPLRYSGLLKEVFGEAFASLLVAHCNPSLNWITLTSEQRAQICAHPDLLPRQGPPESETHLALGICELGRDGQGVLHVQRAEWDGLGLRITGIDKSAAFQAMPVTTPEVFLAIRFDLSLSPEALERQFDKMLVRYLRAPVSQQNWEEISLDDRYYPSLWKPNRETKTARQSEKLTIVPEKGTRFVVCFISCECDIKNARARFRKFVRPENRARLITECAKHSPAHGKFPKKPARAKTAAQKHPWLGLAAFDGGLSVASAATQSLVGHWHKERKGSPSGKPKSTDALSNLDNHRRAIGKRIADLDTPPRSQWASELAHLRRVPTFPFCSPNPA